MHITQNGRIYSINTFSLQWHELLMMLRLPPSGPDEECLGVNIYKFLKNIQTFAFALKTNMLETQGLGRVKWKEKGYS